MSDGNRHDEKSSFSLLRDSSSEVSTGVRVPWNEVKVGFGGVKIEAGRGRCGERMGREVVLLFQSGSERSLLMSFTHLFRLLDENAEKASTRLAILLG